ncbi:polycomb protein SUZ12-like [Ylistrum balloti]|uniref:polycomb protein SUZ12-like n=1 Tax=Ylistrum balloti TaxID=509963 RepID=UPI002905AA51|nr:polycomb protein SUZ12-like [Ylistrum balloti]
MKNRKRQKDNSGVQESQNESAEADRELFLQAFEKPTQIYRYLRTRNIASPIFLHRTLTYMKQRRTCRDKKRKDFKIDSILSSVEERTKRISQTDSYKSQFMNLNFSAFNIDEDYDRDAVDVEVTLLKICHKKRKDASSPVMKTSLGKVQVSVNPTNVNGIPSRPVSTVSVPKDHFVQHNGHSVKSFALLLSVTCPVTPEHTNGICNGDSSDHEEPMNKKRKNGQSYKTAIVYGSELVIYDRQKRCQLSDGDYEIVLKDLHAKVLPKKQASWETIMDGKAVGAFEVFNTYPTLRFTISWTDTAQDLHNTSGMLDAHQEFLSNNQYSSHILSNYNSGMKTSPKDAYQTTPKKRTRMFYQFLYNNNSRQQTEAKDDLHCPWCSLNCMQLYNLFKHLRLCHARFNFIYVPHPKGAMVDVSINERYDGAYAGSPQDLHSHIGYAFSRNGPVRRTPVTHVIVYRPKRPEESLTEFMDHENDNHQTNRQLVQGHNRLYYQTGTRLPITPQEINVESEEESDPLWLRQKTVQMIDEFTDVNEGEKELMKLWNLHIMKHDYIADCQIPQACDTFIEEHGQDIVTKSLCRNLLLHVINLFDFSLIRPENVQRTMAALENIRDQTSETL